MGRVTRFPATSPTAGRGPATRTLASRLAELIRSDIIGGRLLPGARLRLRELAAHYDCGVIPLREALSRLATSGYVDAEDQRGFRVAEVSASDLEDITRVRQDLETAALRDSIAHGDLGWEVTVLGACHRLERIPMTTDAPGLNPDWESAHAEYHRALLAACTSPWLLRLAAMLREQTARYRHLSALDQQATLRAVDEEHRRIADAVVARDARTACELLAEHMAATTRIVLAQIRSEHGEVPGRRRTPSKRAARPR